MPRKTGNGDVLSQMVSPQLVFGMSVFWPQVKTLIVRRVARNSNNAIPTNPRESYGAPGSQRRVLHQLRCIVFPFRTSLIYESSLIVTLHGRQSASTSSSYCSLDILRL